MKPLLIASICLLMLSACGKSGTTSDGAATGWVRSGGNAEGMTLYVDHDTIRKDGDRVEMWHIFDNKTAGTIDNVKKPFMSIKSQEEYNCKEGQSRQIATSFYSENMGKGEVVYSDSSPEPWATAAPGSVGEALFKIACEKK